MLAACVLALLDQPLRLPVSKLPFATTLVPSVEIFRPTAAECTAALPIPVTEKVNAPVCEPLGTETVRVALPPAVIFVIDHTALAPAGSPVVDKETGWGLPAVTDVKTPKVAVSP